MKTYTITKHSVRHETAWGRLIVALVFLSIVLIGFGSFYSDPKPTAYQKFVFLGLLLLIFYETAQAGWYKRRKPIGTSAFPSVKEKRVFLFGLTLSSVAVLVAVILLAAGALEDEVVVACCVAFIFGLILTMKGLWNVE